ncbi:hypothetical protein C3L33_17512, partial [Rhododendron williamsianum]
MKLGILAIFSCPEVGMPYWVGDKEAETLRIGYVKPEIISWSPRIILLHNFLSTEVCYYATMGIKSNVRTSSGMFLNPEERKYAMIQAIEKRISVYSQVPVENGELIQVLRLVVYLFCLLDG